MSIIIISPIISPYSTLIKACKQNWIDNQGRYLDFTTKDVGGKLNLSREAENRGKTILQRMVRCNIRA